MHSRSILFAARSLRKLGGQGEDCGTCFMAKSPMSIGSFMKLMNDDKWCGCSTSATAQGGRLSLPTLDEDGQGQRWQTSWACSGTE